MLKKILVALFIAIAFLATNIQAKAGNNENVTGWLWGGSNTNLGWISTNNLTGGGSVNYGINVPNGDGNVTGYAWSSNIGWINFNPSGPYPEGPNSSVRRVGNNLIGWARIVGIAQESARGNSGGWQGWIKMSGANHRVIVNPSSGQINGYAWSNELGWISFNARIPASTLIVCPNLFSVEKGRTQQLRAYYAVGRSIDCNNHASATDVTTSTNWSSANTSIASVNNTTNKGLVTGVNVGGTNITGSYSGLNATSSATVTSPRPVLIVCPSQLLVNKRGTKQLRAYYAVGRSIDCNNHAGATDVTTSTNWSSANTSIASVNNTTNKGLVTGVNAGRTNVAGSYSGLSANSDVRVVIVPVCGDGIKEGSEECDNGGNNGQCPATCSNSCTINKCDSKTWKETTL